MKKILYSFPFLAICLMLLAGCEEEDPIIHNNENELSDIWLSVPGEKDARFDAEFSAEKDSIYFNVPYFYPVVTDNEMDLSNLVLRANIPLDAKITPSLGVPMDFSNPVRIEVISGTGEVKPYWIVVKRVADLSVKEISIEVDIDGGTATIQGFERDGEFIFYALPEYDLSAVRVYIETDRHASSSLAPGAVVDLSTAATFTVTGIDQSSRTYTMRAVPPKRLEYGVGITRMIWSKSGAEMNFSAHAETGLAVSGDQVIVVSNPSPSKYTIFNRFTGEHEGEMVMPGAIRSFQLTNDEAGHLLGTTYAPKGSDFVIYKWDNPLDPTPEEFIRYTNVTTSDVDGALGRRINIIGNLAQDAVIMVTESRAPHFLRWTVIGGELVSNTPEVITYQSPVSSSWPWLSEAQPVSTAPDTDYFVNYEGEIALVSGTSHNRLVAFTDEKAVVGSYHAPMDYFTFNDAEYLAIVKYVGGVSKAHISLFDVSDRSQISTASTDPGYGDFNVFVSEAIVASSANLNGTADIEVVISDDGLTAWVYMLLTNGGVMGYELTSYDPN